MSFIIRQASSNEAAIGERPSSDTLTTELSMKFDVRDYVPSDVVAHVPANAISPKMILDWLLTPEALEVPAVRNWIGFILVQFAIYQRIEALFPRRNPNRARRGMKDDFSGGPSA